MARTICKPNSYRYCTNRVSTTEGFIGFVPYGPRKFDFVDAEYGVIATLSQCAVSLGKRLSTRSGKTHINGIKVEIGSEHQTTPHDCIDSRFSHYSIVPLDLGYPDRLSSEES